MVTRGVASSYATGGGGTVFEHRYGATLLARLLTGDSIPSLGDDFLPVQVAFQCRAVSPVDDIVVTGRTTDGRQRLLSIGVRRSPEFVPSHVKTVKLLEAYLAVVHDHWDDIVAGRWRLGLVVAAPHLDVRPISRLAELARVVDEVGFRAKVASSRAAVRTKLRHIDEMVVRAAKKIESAVAPSELTWRLLFALWPVEIHVEGGDQRDRADAASRLRSVTRQGTLPAAAALFRRLDELAGDYVPAGAVVTEARLRRDLVGFSLTHSPTHALGWSVLKRLSARLRDRTGTRLTTVDRELEIDRVETREELRDQIRSVGAETGVLIVRGDPDVGKSALTLRIVEELRAGQAGVAAFSLRDLPATMVEFEAILGADTVEVLAGAPVEEVRLLVVDGAEAALEGRQTLLTDLATASLRAGLGVVVVTRTDGASAVADSLMSAQRAVGRAESRPTEYEVPPLSGDEVTQVTDTFRALERLAEDQRPSWVLSRPGLVDLLLRGDAARALPDRVLSEADVFAAIWHGLVRRGAGGIPDVRAHTLMTLARRQLLPGSTSILALDASALTSLRSDALLLPPSWNSGEDFASDLVRDLAVARLFLVDGWSLLTEAGAPRWALRAARLACQATLGAAGADTERRCLRLHQAFEAIAKEHGQRWAELPFEAMLTLGTADEVLTTAWPGLSSAQRSILIRLGVHRYTRVDVGDTAVLAPLVKLSFREPLEIGVSGRLDVDYQTSQLVLAWLRGIADESDETNPIRQSVRDVVLAATPSDRDEFAVEVIALLGPDLNASAEVFLRGLAEHDSAHLRPAFESRFVVWAMARNRLDLLFDLTEACYVVPENYRVPPSDSEVFRALLSTDAKRALPLIQRLLNLAAASDETGVEVELEVGARRLCRGGARTWTWSERDVLVPKECVDALLALQWFADNLVSSGTPLHEVVELLLRDSQNLAMPGLVFGFLLRHVESVVGELDRWLVQPEVWKLERRRRIFSLAPREPDVYRRGWDIQMAAAQLVVSAIQRHDQGRIAALATIGLELSGRVRDCAAADDADETIAAHGSLWADILNAENYQLTWRKGKLTGVNFVPTERNMVVNADEPESERNVEGALFGIALRYSGVGAHYGGAEISEDAIGRLADDLAFVQEIAVCSPVSRSVNNATSRVSVAVVVAHSKGKIAFAASDLRWVANYLMDIPFASGDDWTNVDEAISIALVTLVHPVFFSVNVDYRRLEQSLTEQVKALLNGLDDGFGHCIEPLWSAPCPSTSHCPHKVAWTVIEEVLRQDCHWERGKNRRGRARLHGPLEEALSAIPTEELALDCLPGVLTSCIHAAYSACCVAECARSLLDALLDAYSRAFRKRASGPGRSAEGGDGHRSVAGALFVTAARGDCVPLVAHVRALAGSATALEAFLRDMSCQATHAADVRRALPKVWPLLMATVLDLRLPDDRQYRSALAVLVPEPRVSRQDPWWPPVPVDLAPLTNVLGVTMTNPDEILSAARSQWIGPKALLDLIERWIPVVQGEPRAVSALVGLVRTAPMSWQATTGLRWIERLISGDYHRVEMFSGELLDWLIELHTSEQLAPRDAKVLYRIVDALVAEGSQRAVALQMRLE